MDDVVKCDADKCEDELWNKYDPDDDYDREHDPDFSAQWDETCSNHEEDVIDDERDKW
jgi:hypothetical protein